MTKQKSTLFTAFLMAVVIVITGLAALATYRSIRAQSTEAVLDVHTCTPAGVGAFIDRIHVRCTTPGQPGNAIYYFAYCSRNDTTLASRYLSIFTTAKVTAKNLDIFYDPADTSGTACGCFTSDCRVIWGVEIKP